MKSKLQNSKSKLLKDERKLKKKGFNTGKVVIAAFYAGSAAVVIMSFSAFNGARFVNEKLNSIQSVTATQVENLNKAEFVSSPAGEDYSEGFAKVYMNIPVDPKEREARAKNLQTYFSEGLTLDRVENLSEFTGQRNLKDIKLYRVKDITAKTAVYQYRVVYDVVNITEEVQTIPASEEGGEPQTNTVKKEQPAVTNEALLSVPLGTDGINFNVIEQPYFEALPAASHLSAVADPMDRADQNLKAEAELKDFTAKFFTSYTENTVEEMAYLMEEPGSLKDLYSFQSIESFIVYNGKENEFTVKSLIVMKDNSSGLSVKQPYTLTITKQNGKFFVKKIKHTIGGI